MLLWARKRAGLTKADLADRFPEYRDWEAGKIKPEHRELDLLADEFEMPVNYLRSFRPPDEVLRLADFRSEGARCGRTFCFDLHRTFRNCTRRQVWYEEDYAPMAGLSPLGFVGSAGLQSDPAAVASHIRRLLDLDVSRTKELESAGAALSSLVSKADEAGILVMTSHTVSYQTRRAFDPNVFRGFALVDPVAPLVFLNGADVKTSQVFTLAHELAHLWLGESGVSDVIPFAEGNCKVERWCNEVAAELLVPLDDLREECAGRNGIGKDVSELCDLYKVCGLVIARRLHDGKLISETQFEDLFRRELDRFASRKHPTQAWHCGELHRYHYSRVGKRFAKAIVELDSEEKMLDTDAVKLLDVPRGTSYERFVEELDKVS